MTLAFSYRFKIAHPIAHVISAFFAIFCTFWFGVTLTLLFAILNADNQGSWFFALIPLVLLIVGLVPLSILVFLTRGRARIKIDRERLSASIGALLLHKTFTVSNHSIEDVGIGTSTGNARSPDLLLANNIASCVVQSFERNMPLTWSSDNALNYQVAGLVRNHLEYLGIDLPSN